jgi:hypothetical protein
LVAVFVKQIVRRFHAASLISGALILFSGLSQTGPAGVTSRQVVWLFFKQLWFEFVPVLHGLQGRFTAQG